MQPGIRSLAMNIQHGLKQFESPWFKQRIREAEAAGEERFFSTEDVAAFTADVVQGHFRRLQDDGRITGEWIVFAKYEGQNYYLSLATHDRTTHQHIRQHIDAICVQEFPFLKTQMASETDGTA